MTSFLTQAYSLTKQDTCCDLSIGIEFTVCIVYCHEDLGKAALLLTKRKNTIFLNQIILQVWEIWNLLENIFLI